MARAQDQARWRQHSHRRRIEANLPVETVERLDALAAERGSTRAATLAALIDAAADTGPGEAEAEAEAETATQGATADTRAQAPTHRLRRPRVAEGHDWIVLVDSEPVAGVERDPDAPRGGWRARYLTRSSRYGERSLGWRWCRRRRRDEAVAKLLAAPHIYR